MTFAKGSTRYPPVRTPWGDVQTREEIGKGIWSVSTAGHGGLWLEPATYALMPSAAKTTLYSKGGWYEEDCDALLVYARFPEVIPAPHTLDAVKALLKSNAKYYGAATLDSLGA